MNQNKRRSNKKPKLKKREAQRIEEFKEKNNKKASVWAVRIIFSFVLLSMLMGMMISILQN